jgi:hypothetical protein
MKCPYIFYPYADIPENSIRKSLIPAVSLIAGNLNAPKVKLGIGCSLVLKCADGGNFFHMIAFEGVVLAGGNIFEPDVCSDGRQVLRM